MRVEPTSASVEHNVPAEWRLERARRYLAALPPAIAGGHGDLHTFRVCCRLVRGFALDDSEALELLQEWNARCLAAVDRSRTGTEDRERQALRS